MAKSRETYSKKEKEKKRRKKKEEKQRKREERKDSSDGGTSLDDMIVYVDEFGNFTDTPPDPTKRKKIKAENIEISVPKKDDLQEETIRKGRVEVFFEDKGYGFIIDLDTHEKYFSHVSNMIDEVRERDTVTFEIEQGPKGPNAVRVQKG